MKKWLALCFLTIVIGTMQAISISSVLFEANFSIDEEELTAHSSVVLGQEYDPEKIDEYSANLYEYFHKKGEYFIHIPRPQTIPLEDDSLQLLYQITRFVSGDEIMLSFSGLRYLSESKLREYLDISENGALSFKELPLLFENILAIYEKRGHLFAEVKLDSLILAEKLIAHINIDEGKPLSIKNYHFSGNKISREGALLKSSGLLNVESITQNTLNQAEENLLRKSYIRECNILPLDEENLGIFIKEGKMSFLEGVLGLSEKSGKRELTGMVNIRFLNLWGTDRQIALNWRKTATDLSTLRLSYHESGYGFLPLQGDFLISREAQDSTWIKNQTEMDVYFSSLQHKVGLGFGAQSVFAGHSQVELPKSSEFSASAFWAFQNTRGTWAPVSGYQLEGKYSLHKAKQGLYHKNQASAGKYTALGSGFVHYIKGGYLSTSIKEPKEFDLWGLGGYNSLRGYRENEFLAESLALVQNEIRYLAGEDTILYLLADYAMILKPNNHKKYDFAGFGVGLKQSTRLGMLSIEYALGIRDKSLSNVNLGMIHLGIELAM